MLYPQKVLDYFGAADACLYKTLDNLVVNMSLLGREELPSDDDVEKMLLARLCLLAEKSKSILLPIQ